MLTLWHTLWFGFTQTSIITGWLPITFEVITILAIAITINWKSRHYRRSLLVGLGISAAVTFIVATVLWLTSVTPPDIPPWPYVWGFVFLLALWICISEWTHLNRKRRVISILSVVLALACTLGAINVFTETFITVYRLGSLQPEQVVDQQQVNDMQQQVNATGKLPSHGVVFETTIPPVQSDFQTRKAYVYLPPAWFATKKPLLPTIVMLPGEPGSAADWSSGGTADETADAFAAAHNGLAPILVMPDSNGIKTVDSECVNSQFGNAETYLAVDVPAYAINQLHASPAAGAMAIAGLSAGGTCSMILALNHPNVYQTFASYSGFTAPQYENDTVQQTIDILFGGSKSKYEAASPITIFETSPDGFGQLSGWFEAGSDDTETADAARILQPLAAKAGISTCVLIRPGGHDFELWSQAFADSLPWLSWQIGLTSQPKTEPAKCVTP